MPDQEFKLLITGDASSAVAASQQAGDATRKLKVDTSDLSDETKRSLGMLDPLKEKTKSLGDAVEEAGQKHESSRREMRELGSEIGRTLGVADLGTAAYGKMGAAIFAVGLAIELLKATYDNVQEGIKGPLDIEVKGNSADQIRALAEAYSSFAEALKKAREAQNTPQTGAEADIKILQNKLKLLQDIMKAEEQEALAALAVKKDQMSPQAYADAEARIRSTFGEKENAATQKEKQDEIDRRKIEADDLDKKSQEEKARGEAVAKRTGTFSDAQKNADTAGKAMEEIEKNIAMVKRYKKSIAGGEVTEYEGATGKVQQAKDYWAIQQMAGADQSIDDLLKSFELRLAQAQAAVAQGAQAKAQENAGKDATAQAAKDKAEADRIRQQAQLDQWHLDAENQNQRVTKALGGAGTALGQEHAAEHNNTPTGIKDAVAAQLAAAKELADIGALMKEKGLLPESVKALAQAYADLKAEDAKILRLLRQSGFNTK